MHGVLEAVARIETSEFQSGSWQSEKLADVAPYVRGCLRPPMRQADRAIDWMRDKTAIIVRTIRAADSAPGVLGSLLGKTLVQEGMFVTLWYPPGETNSELIAAADRRRPMRLIGNEAPRQPHHLDVAPRLALKPTARLDSIEITVDIELQEVRRLIRGSSRRLRIDPAETQLTKIKLVNKDVNHANRIILVDPVIQAFRKNCRLPAIHPRNKAFHPIPRKSPENRITFHVFDTASVASGQRRDAAKPYSLSART